jgi:hypothetical protein
MKLLKVAKKHFVLGQEQLSFNDNRLCFVIKISSKRIWFVHCFILHQRIASFQSIFREKLQRISPKNKVKQSLMLKVHVYVVYKWLNHAVQSHFYKLVKQCIVLLKIWIFIVIEYHLVLQPGLYIESYFIG